MTTQPHESLALQRATIEALPPETIAELKQEFLDRNPELAAYYARRFTKPGLPTLFVVWAFDVRGKRQA